MTDKGPGHPVQVVLRFTDALNARDLDAMMALLDERCIFDSTYPPPDGARFEGYQELRNFWKDFFRFSIEPRFEIEEIFDAGERVVMRWLYRWGNSPASRGHVRGVDLYKIKNGLIVEKLSYVKG